jgi:hypothetical protein
MPCKVNNRHFIFALKTDSADIGNWLIFQRYKYRCYLLQPDQLIIYTLLGNVVRHFALVRVPYKQLDEQEQSHFCFMQILAKIR